MGALSNASGSPSQWLFPPSALQATPSLTTSDYTLERELYDRARGIEFLYRLGSSLGLPSPAMFTAATWFHRFFMRQSMEDYHRQDVAASCIFLATKTEECGRKLCDVARVCQSKITGQDIQYTLPGSPEVEQCQTVILQTEKVLLEALCFDFAVESPHAELVDLFEAHNDENIIQDYAWSIAHDSYRTPLCLLWSPRIIATACYILAQRTFDGANSPSLDARISATAPSRPTPGGTCFATEFFALNEVQLSNVSEAISILLEFYVAQDIDSSSAHLASLAAIPPPTTHPLRPRFYTSFAQQFPVTKRNHSQQPNTAHDRTPSSSHGGNTPARGLSKSNVGPPIRVDGAAEKKHMERLDLS